MKDKKSLIIYFSRADENYSVGFINKGNTEVIAEYIKNITNAYMIKVEPANPYSKDYNTCIKEAKERQINHNAPIVKEVGDISSYDVIYIGSPVYWGYMPEELVTALRNLDFKGKIIRPFITHEGSFEANVVKQIENICKTKVEKPLVIKGSLAHSSKNMVENWI